MAFTDTIRTIENAYNFDADALAIQDWLQELLIGDCQSDLQKLSRAQATVLRACLAEHAADPTGWYAAWDGKQIELYS
jgi:hypothetical protein